MLFNHIAQRSTKAEWLCNSVFVQNVAWITDRCIETKYNEPCDNAFQSTLEHFFLLKQWGHFFLLEGWVRGDQQPAQTSSCFCTHPHKRIGRNGVSSSLAPSARQINCRKLPTKSQSAILVTLYSHTNDQVLKEHWCDLMWAQLSF